jgi:cobyrinic acid a,c-diamide synthase
MPKAFVIAGERSGCGKTLATLGIMAALIKRGYVVQPFKAGPDFIDPGHHERVTGQHSHNLDGWMTGPDGVKSIFSRHATDCDVAVIEGVMGLFDGASGKSEDGSTAQLAKWLGAPVVLVLDAASIARSAAALAHGYLSYDPDLSFAGLVLNKVGSQNHKDLLFDALSTIPQPNPLAPVEVVGFLPRDPSLSMPSRHLGLVTDQDHGLTLDAVDNLARWADENLNLPRLMAVLPDIDLAPLDDAPPKPMICRIAIARDQAFCFYYHENLRTLEHFGAELVPFSPLTDQRLPDNIDALYLGGGYPELHAPALSANTAMLADIRAFSASGKPVYAECGGFMYLMAQLTSIDGRQYGMAGIFSMRAAMRERFQALGYREVVTLDHSPFGPPWTMLRGHEFHYSEPETPDPEAQAVYKTANRKGWTDQVEGFIKGNTLGSYIHLHFGSNPEAAEHFVHWCAGKRMGEE